MAAALKFFINQSANDAADALVASFTGTGLAPACSFNQGDRARAIELHFLTENPDPETRSEQPFLYDDPVAWDGVKFAAGVIDAAVDGGNMGFTDPASGQTYPTFGVTSTGAALQTAFRTYLSTNYGSCVITGDAGGPWTIDRVTAGAISALTGSTTAVSPPNSSLEIVELQAGTSSLSAKFHVTLSKAPAILKFTGWSALPVAAVGVTAVTAGSSTTNEVQKVTWNADAYDGSVSLSVALPAAGVATAISLSSSTIVTSAAHGLVTGDSITVSGSNSSPSIDGTRAVTVLDADRFTFTTPVNVTTAGTAASWTATLTRAIGPIAYDVTEDDFEALLAEHSSAKATVDDFDVLKLGAGNYSITFKGQLANTDIATMTATQALSVPVGLTGTVDCLTAGVLNLLNGSKIPVETNLEIEKTIAGQPSMLAQRDDATIRPELISSSPGSASVLAPLAVSAGGTGVSSLPKFRVYKSGSQTITNSVSTLVTWDTESWDASGYFASNAWTPLVAGVYHFDATVLFNGLTDGVRATIYLYKNGSAIARVEGTANSASNAGLMLSADATANGSTDTFTIYVEHVDAASRIIFGGSSLSYWSGHFIP